MINDDRAANAANAYLAAIIESSDDAIISKNLDGIITSWNPAAEKMYGWTAAETIGQSIYIIIPQGHEDEELAIISRLRLGIKIDHFETVRRAKDGKLIPVSITISPIRNDKGTIIGASKIARDISERKKHEEELAQRDRHKDEFLAMLAHELRNPLAPISNAIEIARKPASTEQVKAQALSMASQQVSHMVRLLDDLLDAARITHGKISLRTECIDIREPIWHAITSAGSLMKEYHHKVETRLPKQPLWVMGDETRISQLLGNLLNNAAKYTPSGGTISIEIEDNGNDIDLRVRDNGIGIAPDQLPHIFDLFAQADNSIERSHGGLGIGLMLVKNIAIMHGGGVKARSEGTGKGTEFTVIFPKAEKPLQVETEADAAAEQTAAAYNVLVVDDNEASAKTLGWMMEAMGHKVELAYSAKAALSKAQEFKPNVVLLDIGMPDMNGYELCREMHRLPLLKGTTYIAQTGWGQDQHLARAREAGFDFHLTKPISFEALQKQLEDIGKKAA